MSHPLSHVLPAALQHAGAHILAPVSTVKIRPCRDILAVEQQVGREGRGGGHQSTQALWCDIRQAREVEVMEAWQAGGGRQRPVERGREREGGGGGGGGGGEGQASLFKKLKLFCEIQSNFFFWGGGCLGQKHAFP